MKEILSFRKLNASVDKIVSADDYRLHLDTGETLIDTMSGLWCTPLGYSNEPIKQAMVEQLNILPYGNNFTGNQNEVTERYAEKLCEITNMDRVYFASSGSAAVETAIKLSSRSSGICAKHSYHGSTILCSSVSDQSINEAWGIDDNILIDKFSNVDEFLDWKERVSIEDSFCIIEPVIGAGGVYEWPSNVFTVLEEYQREGGLVIFDEVITGFGKLGTMFAFQKYDFKPDILVLGKAMTNGYFPMSACLVKEHVLKDIKFFNHGFTFSGHPVGCAAALATLEELDKIISTVFDLKLNNVKAHRQVGCMGAIDFGTVKNSLKFIKSMRERGYIMEDGSENSTTTVYCLPYIMSKKDYILFVNTMQGVIDGH